ncbi:MULTISPECIES: YidH family protein [Mumia]|uniref:YidH family protein n=1 Tax=Mumia TaxID=1546255 RepID=UPI001420C89B|nr:MULTISPECIES: DUF202 domain-containing protein [unclassified Mumia]QMW66993.1 DUF202 domain-containing protein [Mumia sp. ZJ1417]
MSNVQLVLANERTYLAYIRTALALMAAGVAIIQFGDNLGGKVSTRAVGGVILGSGIVLAYLGYSRWRDNDRQIAETQPLHATRAPFLLALSVAAFGIAVLALSLF